MIRNIILPIAVAGLLVGCGGPAPILFTTVGAAGAAINEYNSGEFSTSVDDAADRIIDGVTDGFKRDEFVGHEMND